MKNTLLIAAAICALHSPTQAMTDGIQNHEVQILFMDAPCGQAVKKIDDPALGMEGMGMMAMAFGFLMGFEATHPGIRGSHETVLMRLRDACASSPDSTALDLLQGFAQD